MGFSVEHIEDIELMEDLEWTQIHFSIELIDLPLDSFLSNSIELLKKESRGRSAVELLKKESRGRSERVQKTT